MEDKKKIALIVTIVTILLCGCPGLCLLSSGVMFSSGFDLENAGWEVSGNPQAVAIPLICFGLVFILIPIIAGIITFVLSRKKEEIEEIDVPNPLNGE